MRISDERLAEIDTRDLFEIADTLADAAALETLAHFRSAALDIANKQATAGTFDPVTQADRAAEAAMRAVLERARPRDGILGEELDRVEGASGLTWVLDPIDGTRAYMIGAPTWGTLIALCDDDGPLLGLIDQPFTGERWYGGPGRADIRRASGTEPLGTRRGTVMEDALLCSTFPEVGSDEERAAFQRVSQAARLTRYGMDCYAYGLVAAGCVDLVVEAGLQAYDVCAPIAVIEAAGGIVTDWEGGRADGGGRVLAAANPQIHQAALELLNAA
ncbi:MAG: histidinol-phosphatase [Pseudomonadota bacterium]